MKTQHTPGPLLVADSGRNTWVVFYNLPTVGDQELNQKVIAEVDNIELANLIAAVTELLEALEACKVTLEAFLPDAFATISVVKSAIAKAKGE